MKHTLTFYEYTTVCHKYVVEADVPDGADLTEWLLDEDEANGLSELLYDALGKEISNEVEGMEVWDSDGQQLLLQY